MVRKAILKSVMRVRQVANLTAVTMPLFEEMRQYSVYVWEGIIWTQFAVERSGGNNQVFAYAERASNADWSASEELFFKNLGPINLDQEYELLIEKKGTLVEYKLDGAVVHSFDLATDHSTILSGDDFSPVGDVESSLDTRVQNDSGRAHVTFDDVVTDEVPSTGVGPTNAGSSGGGAMNPWTLLFAFGLLASLARRRQQ